MKKEERENLLKELLSETSEVHSMVHGIWTGLKGVSWQSLPKEARNEVLKEFHYFEAGQILGWIVKISLIIICLKSGITFFM